MSRGRSPEGLQVWIAARKRHHLSHAHVQMARELGMNAKKLGKLDIHQQEAWKLPLLEFIEDLYRKRFGKPRLAANRRRRIPEPRIAGATAPNGWSPSVVGISDRLRRNRWSPSSG